MANTNRHEALEAKQGEKIIEVKIRLWPSDVTLTPESGKVLAKHAWSSGMAWVERNRSHEVLPGSSRPFHFFLNVDAVIEKVLIDCGIVLHPSSKMKKYTAV